MWSPAQLAGELAAAMDGDPHEAAQRWAASGAMRLTGNASGPALAGPARIALAVQRLADLIARSTAATEHPVDVDGPSLLGERAAIAGLTRHGPVSCGGQCQLLEAADGWIALSLARDEDLALLSAWVEHDVHVPGSVPVIDWAPIAAAVRKRPARHLSAQAALLGLPAAAVGEVTAATGLVGATDLRAGAAREHSVTGATVVDLSALWAGPLCAHLLGLAGAQVVKVESWSRPDGARRGPPQFFDLLHAGHRSVAIDFDSPADRRALVDLLDSADIVIEASRPRALEHLGASYAHLRDRSWDGLWLSITAYGRRSEQAMRVGFGDDAAAAAGLVAVHEGQPVFCADAIADPATGLLGAAALLSAWSAGCSGLLEVSLATTAAHLAAGVDRHDPVEAPGITPAMPAARVAAGRAAPLGADTAPILGR